jgi:hypothetical protein
MRQRLLSPILTLVVAAVGLLPITVATQNRFAYLKGQDVVPVYEGWERQPDGAVDMLFGYLNRNYQEQLTVPIGAANSFEPGEPDRGQPTFFYAGRQLFVFRVRIPADWGKRDLVWTLTSHGTTEKAYGSLLPTWEVDSKLIAHNKGLNFGLEIIDRNKPPTVRIDPVTVAAGAATVKLSASVSDDGIPSPAATPAPSQTTPANGSMRISNTQIPELPRGLPKGLTLRWILYRGPGIVTFKPSTPQSVTSGSTVTTTATFGGPGEYILRAIASDSVAETPQDVKLNIEGVRR